MAYTCAVNSCSNGTYRLKKWKAQLCDVCGCHHSDAECTCEPPFRLYPFPTTNRDQDGRTKWKQLVGRSDGKKLWSPSKDSRVCSLHFVDGQPTTGNPLPTVKMGYDGADKRVKRMVRFQSTTHTPTPKRRRKLSQSVIVSETSCDIPSDSVAPSPDPEDIVLPKVKPNIPWILTLLALFTALCKTQVNQKEEIKKLKTEIVILKAQNRKLRNTAYSEKILQNDSDVNFLTGIATKSMFDKLHSQISQFVTRKWRGVVSMSKNIRTFRNLRCGPERKLTSKSEFLLMLMKLRLGLTNKDLAKRFDISDTLCSRIFFTWLKAASEVLKSLFVSDQESLIATKPQRYRKLSNLHSIIDCTEVFIETPKDPHLQSATWSEYKHHNTLKVLVACAPNSAIIFLSHAYPGRLSDKVITVESGFLDSVPMNWMVMADKGFNILDECEKRSIHLYVPPGKRGLSQMTSSSVERTKEIANLRILIEQVIRRLKTFRILAAELPIQMIEHIDDILTVCGGLCNLREPIYKV